MDFVYQVWCEWDVGQEGVVFDTPETAKKWISENVHLVEMAGYEGVEGFTPLDFMGEGLVGIESLVVIT